MCSDHVARGTSIALWTVALVSGLSSPVTTRRPSFTSDFGEALHLPAILYQHGPPRHYDHSRRRFSPSTALILNIFYEFFGEKPVSLESAVIASWTAFTLTHRRAQSPYRADSAFVRGWNRAVSPPPPALRSEAP
jgi:hypothetical protein